MTPEAKRAIIAAVRRVAFAGLIILGAWLVLAVLREAIPANIIDLLNQEIRSQGKGPVDLADWSRSWWTGEPVPSLVSQRLGTTVRLLLMGGLLSLVIAVVLLFLGLLISRVTERPPWLAQIRRILRLILVDGGVTTSVFTGTAIGALLIVFSAQWWVWAPPQGYQGISWWPPAFAVSLLPAWLLVQAGHGELATWPKKLTGHYWTLARHLGVRLVVRLLKLAGAIIVVTVLVDQTYAVRGLGTLMMQAIFQRDFPVVFGIAWVFVPIVVLAKLVADLVEIAYNHFGRPPVSSERREEPAVPRIIIPKGWLIFCLVLVFVSVMVAMVGPAFAPYGYNELDMANRLALPSAAHILGTDNLGRDVFSRLLFALRTDLATSLAAAAVVLAIAAGWAVLAAYLRKANNWLGDTLEDVAMLAKDILCAFPWLVLLLLLISLVGPGLFQVTLTAGLVLLPHTVGMMQEAYWSPPTGQGWLYSTLWSIPVTLLFAVAGGILYISSLSYLGLGVPPPTPELGGMLSQGRLGMFQAPWLALWPSLVLILLCLVWIMAGDALLERLGFRSKAVWAKVVE
jgi:peptide/nickel transport system permease protein